jgi:lipopolysaccharide heptosyltransferase II
MHCSKILLIRLRQIGDVVFTTPAIRCLRQMFPGAHLTYVVEPAAAPIVALNPHLNEVIVAPPASRLRQLPGDIALGLRLKAASYDLAIDFHGGPRSSLLAWLSRAPVRLGYEVSGRSWMYTTRVARPRELRRRHSVENQWDLLLALGAPPPDPEAFPVEMPVDRAVAERIGARLAAAGVGPADRLIVIHVSAGNPFRRWPVASFVSLAAALASRDPRRRIVITAGPSAWELAGKVTGAARSALGPSSSEQVLACGDFSLDELRALFDRAVLFIGGDSGPLHVAATSHVPVVGLYGPTLPVRSTPWRAACWTTESVDAGDLPCRPCDQRVCAPGDFRCLAWIQPGAVVDAAERALARGKITG